MTKLASLTCLALVAATACASPSAPPKTPAARADVAAADPELQRAAEEELARALASPAAAGAHGGIAIVLAAKTGDVLAIATRGDGDARAARIPGSTMKPFTFAAALDAGVIDLATRVDCEQGRRAYGDQVLLDASAHGELDLGGVLAVSSNVCTAKLAEPLGDRLAAALRRYHFAPPAHVDPRTYAGATIAAGEGMPATALEVAAGYTAFADDGLYHAPGAHGAAGERVMTAATARAVAGLLDRVVNGDDGTGHAARIEGVHVIGKTGTAGTATPGRNYASFVGIVPADAPRYVTLIGIDGTTASGGEIAAPAFARLMTRALAQPAR